MFVISVHTGQVPVQRILFKMSTPTANLKSLTFLAKLLELVSTNSYINLYMYIVMDLQSSTLICTLYIYIYSEKCKEFVNWFHIWKCVKLIGFLTNTWLYKCIWMK
jgi:hypothetical protein